MNIALIGYGRMGKEIERIALSRGHSIGLKIDKNNLDDFNSARLADIDVAIEFTQPGQALDNIKKCLKENVPVVSGTTGWVDNIEEAIAATLKSNSAFMYASNFSIGVNIVFHMNNLLSGLMRGRDEYKPVIEEIHHINKLDAPSGTAISLAQGIMAMDDYYKKWIGVDSSESSDEIIDDGVIPIVSKREGNVAGKHEIRWISSNDSICLSHEASGREGFAIGAVLAAEFVLGKSGFLSMRDMLGF